MIDVRAWAEYIVEWAAKDPYGFLTSVILALTPFFIASALLSWKLAKMIEARDREQKKKQKRQENIARAKRTKKDWMSKYEDEGTKKEYGTIINHCLLSSKWHGVLPCSSCNVNTGLLCLTHRRRGVGPTAFDSAERDAIAYGRLVLLGLWSARAQRLAKWCFYINTCSCAAVKTPCIPLLTPQFNSFDLTV